MNAPNLQTEENIHTQTLAENLQFLLEQHEINGSDLAKSLNIPYNTIHRILKGTTSDPRISTLQQIADYFKVSIDFLLDSNASNEGYSVPLLSWEALTQDHFIEQIDRKNWHRNIKIPQMDTINDLSRVFALEGTRSMQPRFPLGTTFIIGLQEEPLDGDLVLIKFKENNTVTLRDLIMDSPYWQLNAIIPGSPPLIFKHQSHTIMGVVLLTLIQTRPV